MIATKKHAREASKTERCPLCDRDHYCFLIGEPIEKVICQWAAPNNPPQGWNYQGESKDRRPMFSTAKKRHKGLRYSDLIELKPKALDFGALSERVEPPSALSPGDIVRNTRTGTFATIRSRKGKTSGGKQRLLLSVVAIETGTAQEWFEDEAEYATYDEDEGAQLEEIIYEYPHPHNKGPLGRVVRRQWSDRRPWMEGGRKTKEIRPYYWKGKGEEGKWQQGRGEATWPLYREDEAKDEIIRGGIVFAVAGEQAVEIYRRLGLIATTCQGGEANWEQIAIRLEDAFSIARSGGEKPLLVIHPDFDLTGANTFGSQLRKKCDDYAITCCVLDPQDIWGNIGHGDDIREIVADSGMAPADLLKALEFAIDEGIDRKEKAELLRKQRDRWGAPDSLYGELGVWREQKDTGERHFVPLTNFDFQIEKEVSSSEGGGFILQLKRAGEHRQFRVFLPSLEFTATSNFENTLKKALGGALICRLNTNQMKALLRVRLHEYTHTRGGKTYRLTERVGQQGDGHWIFPRCQLTAQGEPTDENTSLWIWNTNITGDESTLPKPHIAPPNNQAIAQMVDAMFSFYGAKTIAPALMTLGYAAAACHYQQIIEEDGAFPILNAIGDAGSGKTTAAACALSLVGMHTEAAGGMLRDVSVSAAYEHLKITGSLLHVLDDPARTPELDEFLKGLYNGKARLVRGQNGAAFNMQRPHSPLMVTSNFAAGETNAATMSRLIQIWFDNTDQFGGSDAYRRMQSCWERASGGLPQLIKLGYPKPAISAIEQDLAQHLPHAHSRIARSLALIVAYTEAICVLGNVGSRVNIRDFAIQTVCRMANDVESSGDSLRDFLDKLSILRSQAKVGDWNMKWVAHHNSTDVKGLALHLPSVWSTVNKEFKLPYNLQIIKNLLAQRGALTKATHRFHGDEDVSRAFQRGNTDDPKWQRRRCVEIPIEIIKGYVDIDLSADENDVNWCELSEKKTETPTTTGKSQFTSTCELKENDVNWCELKEEETENLSSQDLPVHTPSSQEDVNSFRPGTARVRGHSESSVHSVHTKNARAQTKKAEGNGEREKDRPRSIDSLTFDAEVWLNEAWVPCMLVGHPDAMYLSKRSGKLASKWLVRVEGKLDPIPTSEDDLRGGQFAEKEVSHAQAK